MEVHTIISVTTVLVTFLLGLIAKKVEWFNNNLIPLQNLFIGCIAGGIYYGMTKDISLVITTIGLGTGGAYDLGYNLLKIFQKEQKDITEEGENKNEK